MPAYFRLTLSSRFFHWNETILEYIVLHLKLENKNLDKNMYYRVVHNINK